MLPVTRSVTTFFEADSFVLSLLSPYCYTILMFLPFSILDQQKRGKVVTVKLTLHKSSDSEAKKVVTDLVTVWW